MPRDSTSHDTGESSDGREGVAESTAGAAGETAGAADETTDADRERTDADCEATDADCEATDADRETTDADRETSESGRKPFETWRRTFLKGSAAALGASVVPAAGHSGTAVAAHEERVGEVATATGQGMVSSSHPQATAAGADVLREGGNAIDAAAATQFALNVVQPHSSGIGGGGFTLVYVAERDELYAIDNRERAPMGANPEMFLDDEGEPVPFRERHTNGKAVGVPGTLRAIDVAIKRFGSREIRELIGPAIRLADAGCPRVAVDESLAGAIEEEVEDELFNDAAREVFAPGGDPLTEGDRLVQPDLADTLRTIRDEGIEPFYKGAIAEDVAETVQGAARFREEGGSMTVEDLARYNVEVTLPDHATYSGAEEDVTVRTMSLPSSGGLTVGHILGLLEPFDLAGAGAESVQAYHLMLEAFRLAYADRGEYMGDTEFVDAPWQGLLDEDYLDDRRALMSADRATEEPGEPGDPWAYQPGEPYRTGAGGSNRAMSNRGQTTHFTTADAEGNLVSWTSTIEQLFGSGIMVPGRGFMLNNELTDFDAEPGGPNEVRPNKRPLSSTSPTIVFRDGEPFFTVGSPGGTTIITTVAEIALNVAEFGMSLDEAVAAPRIYSSDDPTVYYDPTLPEEVQRGLTDRGHDLAEDTFELGNAQAIQVLDDGYLGVGDYRRNSAVEGVD